MKTNVRIIVILTGVFLFYTILFSGFIYYSITKYAYEDFYKRLELRAVTAVKIELEQPLENSNIIEEFRKGFLEPLPNEKSYVFLSQNEEIKKKIAEFDLPKQLLTAILKNNIGTSSVGNTFYAGIIYEVSGTEYVSIVSADNYYNSHHIVYLRNLLVISMVVALIIIFLTAILFTKKILLPIEYITSKVKEISSENMHLRLPIPHKNNELELLVKTFNDMLNRLETSFETQKNFISNASHELNTPLTTIIGEADVVLSKIRKPEEYIQSLATILEEAESLDKKTRALLFLAQTGFDGKVQKFDKVRIDQLLLDVKETVIKIYPKANLQLDFSLLPEAPEKLKVKGNEQLLHLAFSNVIMNGCKYSDNQEVRVSLGVTDKEVVVVIKDSGIGIPEDEMKFIFDPFFRASNTKRYDGYGIGLPLTRNVVQMHNGRLIINSKVDKGTTVEIRIPLGNYSL